MTCGIKGLVTLIEMLLDVATAPLVSKAFATSEWLPAINPETFTKAEEDVPTNIPLSYTLYPVNPAGETAIVIVSPLQTVAELAPLIVPFKTTEETNEILRIVWFLVSATYNDLSARL